MSRWLSPLLAFCSGFTLLLVFLPLLMPSSAAWQQSDFMLLLLLLQLLLALPMLLLEAALAKRSQSSALHGIMQLTREIDASPRWRGLAWGGALLLALFASFLLHFATQQSLNIFQLSSNSINPIWIYVTLLVLTFGLSVVGRQLLIVITASLSVVLLVMACLHLTTLHWPWTAFTLREWAFAVALVSLNSVMGAGVYWQLHRQQASSTLNQTQFALPILVAQLLAIVAAALTLHASFKFMGVLSLLLSMVLAAVFWQLLLQQLQQRQALLWQKMIIVLLPVLLLLLLFKQLNFSATYLLALLCLSLLLATGYAIFVGWKMKISHLRKALGLNEAWYNVWRIMVRVLLPLTFMFALLLILVMR